MRDARTVVEFYRRGGGLLSIVQSYAVPREGEYINIAKQQWRVAYVAWAIDTDPKQLRANVELEKASNSEVGPARFGRVGTGAAS